jgi:NAD+ synthase (glutamine-hydrolysing)
MSRQLKIVMAQLNFLVGDIDGNAKLVIANAEKAIAEHTADVIVFPELTLTGYPLEDLLLRPSLQVRINKALASIQQAKLSIAIVMGFPQHCDLKLYNALAIIENGVVSGRYFKQCLPNYQVFDERRYFTPGTEACVVEIKGVRCAFTICEDMWQFEPVQQAKSAGAQLLININASPFHVNKLEERRRLLKTRSQEGCMPIIYVNLVGGQDELVFDGGSMAVDVEGKCCVQAPKYEEGLYPVTVDVNQGGSCGVVSGGLDHEVGLEEDVYGALVLGVRDYVNKNKFTGIVLGLSGGIDSALTLAIAVDALGSERVEAVMMPFEYTSELSKHAASKQAKALGVAYKVIPINDIYASLMSALESEFAGFQPDVSEQNLQARARGVLLMGISNKKGLLVLTTGNKSEIAVGYSTLYGDMAGGFNALKDVSKTLVYKLARYRNYDYSEHNIEVIPREVIEREPSAELLPEQTDQDTLPEYRELDAILELYVEKDFSAQAIMGEGFNEDVVRRVLRLVDRNEYKRRQSPVGIRLTERGFGRDRRYPITNAWPLGE